MPAACRAQLLRQPVSIPRAWYVLAAGTLCKNVLYLYFHSDRAVECESTCCSARPRASWSCGTDGCALLQLLS
jgi:hypothetical protein